MGNWAMGIEEYAGASAQQQRKASAHLPKGGQGQFLQKVQKKLVPKERVKSADGALPSPIFFQPGGGIYNIQHT